MVKWRPSANCLLTLKQLGFSPQQIDRALTTYHPVGSAPNDEGFKRALTSAPEISNEQHQGLKAAAQIPLAWKPSTATERTLIQRGFSQDIIAHYREIFVIQTRESGTVLRSPDAAFKGYCRDRSKALPKPIPTDWLPAVSTIEEVAVHTGRDWNHITDQLSRFIDLHQHSMAADWDGRFLSWMLERNSHGSLSERQGVLAVIDPL